MNFFITLARCTNLIMYCRIDYHLITMKGINPNFNPLKTLMSALKIMGILIYVKNGWKQEK